MLSCPSIIVTIVVLSRLVYRKGIDLLVHIVPRICKIFSYVQFVIAGDGPKRIDLEQMQERHLLHEQVILLPSCKHHDVYKVSFVFLQC